MTKSWVSIHAESDFSLDNLPLGVFSTPSSSPHVGIAVGDYILDCHALTRDGLLDGALLLGGASCINGHLALGADAWAQARAAISAILSTDSELARSPDASEARYLIRQGSPHSQAASPRLPP